MRHLTVGEMAKLNHISEQTLRLYDKRGLLSPSFRGQNGYRYYDIKQSAVLDIIQYMKSLGISLKEIKHQLENRDLGRIEAALREKQRQKKEGCFGKQERPGAKPVCALVCPKLPLPRPVVEDKYIDKQQRGQRD